MIYHLCPILLVAFKAAKAFVTETSPDPEPSQSTRAALHQQGWALAPWSTTVLPFFSWSSQHLFHHRRVPPCLPEPSMVEIPTKAGWKITYKTARTSLPQDQTSILAHWKLQQCVYIQKHKIPSNIPNLKENPQSEQLLSTEHPASGTHPYTRSRCFSMKIKSDCRKYNSTWAIMSLNSHKLHILNPSKPIGACSSKTRSTLSIISKNAGPGPYVLCGVHPISLEASYSFP